MSEKGVAMKTLTIEINVTGTKEEISQEMGLILRLIAASNFSKIIGYSVIDGRTSYGVLNYSLNQEEIMREPAEQSLKEKP